MQSCLHQRVTSADELKLLLLLFPYSFFECNRTALNPCSSKKVFSCRGQICFFALCHRLALLTMAATQADRNSKLERDTGAAKPRDRRYFAPGECLCRQSLGYQKLFAARTEAWG